MRQMRMFWLFLAGVLACHAAFAQGQNPDEAAAERARQLFESIDTQVEKDTKTYKLEDWQIFKVDSTLTHDYQAMFAECEKLAASKVGNYTMYTQVQDHWAEQTYRAYEQILNPEQWAKYLKSGAARAKKARDKRAAKVADNEKKLKEKLGKHE